VKQFTQPWELGTFPDVLFDILEFAQTSSPSSLVPRPPHPAFVACKLCDTNVQRAWIPDCFLPSLPVFLRTIASTAWGLSMRFSCERISLLSKDGCSKALCVLTSHLIAEVFKQESGNTPNQNSYYIHTGSLVFINYPINFGFEWTRFLVARLLLRFSGCLSKRKCQVQSPLTLTNH